MLFFSGDSVQSLPVRPEKGVTHIKNGFIFKKLLISLGILFVVITLNFFLPRMIYEDPATPYYAGVPEDALALREAIRVEYGFDKPMVIQYLIYLGKILRFDFGTSYIYKEPVFDVMFKRIPWSMILSLSTMLLSVFSGIAIGAVASKNRGKWQDNTVLGLSTLTTAIPTFWLAMVSLMLFAFIFHIFPYRGAMTEGYVLVMDKGLFGWVFGGFCVAAVVLWKIFRKGWITFTVPIIGLIAAVFAAVPLADISDIAYHAALPVAVTTFGSIVGYAMLVRNSMIGVVNEDYILTARAKGVPQRHILFRHTFRNALLPLVTNIGLGISGLIGGSVLIEEIFTWPGMGTLLLEANNFGDFQLSQAILLLFAAVTIAANFVTDLIYHKLDPRVSIL